MDNTFVSSLLVELLSEYNRVSLPCLGSFMGQYRPAYFSEDGKYIYPPSKQIDFHQNEIWNDERLEKLIAEREGVSMGEAKEKLAFWIDDICVKLSMGEKIILPGLGEFTVSYGNRLKFIQYEEKNLLLEAYGFEPMELDLKTAPSSPVPPPTSDNRNRFNNAPPPSQPNNKKSGIWIWITLLLLFLLIVISAALIHFRVIPLPDSVIEKYPWIDNYLKPVKYDRVDDRALFVPNETGSNIDSLAYNELLTMKIDTAGMMESLIDSIKMLAVYDSIKNAEQVDSMQAVPNQFYHIIVKSANTYNDARTYAKEWAKKDYVVQILYTNEKEPYKLSIAYFNSQEEADNKLAEYKKSDSDFKNALVFEYINEDN